MRPTRLEIEGFASFREHTEIVFDDADLFVLFGPTGAGKSSIIDALVFALYGTVPRYGDKRLVAPVISQGLNEARVRLDFLAGGRPYTAVRVVQRTKTGATTKEARLESGTATLAGTADELTAEVTVLLGLSFEHFTRCVVLPQGAFAEFLHAKPAERQDLLVQLLGLDLYERIRNAATQRAREKEARATSLEERLAGELADATAEAAAAATARVETLAALLATIEAARTELEELNAKYAKAAEAAKQAETRATLLDGVVVPENLEDLIRRVTKAASRALETAAALEDAGKARESADAARAELPERAQLDAAAKTHDELRTADARLKTAADESARAGVMARTEAEALDAAERSARAAEDALDAIKRERAAAHLAEHIVVGEPCPVCLQTVAALPGHADPPGRDAARHQAEAAQAAVGSARTAAQRASHAVATAEANVVNARTRRDQLARECGTLPALHAIEQLRGRIDAADAALAQARTRETAARSAYREAEESSGRLEAERSLAWKAFDALRDRLSAAALAPPPASRDDLSADWTALTEWSQERVPEERRAVEEQRAAAETARTRFEWRIEEQRSACAAADVAAPAGNPRDACVHALAEATARKDRLDRDLETARTIRTELAVVARDANTAKDLARHLDARNFERWLMTRALHRLIAGATQVLRELSGGAYSLALDQRNDFLVVDHRNADERRMARTLSGGETFLASLSLALALAEQVAEVTAGGAAKLEALFLDEGFGTLDADTLDIVAAAIEELGSRGRMVGIVTHVRDLAERVPVRFDVQKIGGNSRIERVVRPG